MKLLFQNNSNLVLLSLLTLVKCCLPLSIGILVTIWLWLTARAGPGAGGWPLGGHPLSIVLWKT